METVKQISSALTPKLPELTLEVPEVPIIEVSNNIINENILSTFFTKLISNKNYIYVLLLVLVLAIIGYYLYIKYFSKILEKKVKPEETKIDNSKEEKKQILNPKNDYYIIDPNGKPILITPYFIDILKNSTIKQNPELFQIPSQQQYAPPIEHFMPHKIPQVPQVPQVVPPVVPKVVPQVPQSPIEKTESENSPESEESSSEKTPVENSRLSNSNDLNQIPDNVMLSEAEDDNIANQDLTNDEIIELKRQLEIMQKNQNYQITAQNDD